MRWMRQIGHRLLAACALACACAAGQAASLQLHTQGLQATMDNGLLQVQLDKGELRLLSRAGKRLMDASDTASAATAQAKPSSGYVDYTGDKNQRFNPTALRVLEQSEQLLHIAYVDERAATGLLLEVHYLLRPGVAGLYSYVVAGNPMQQPLRVQELRAVYRFNPFWLHTLHNGQQVLQPHSYAELALMTKVQDETWQLPDQDPYGQYYTKYDWAGYQRQTPVWGVLGRHPSGVWLGAWVVPAGTEYFSGDALRQDLLVHQDALALVYMTGAHLGSTEMQAPPGWRKRYGPWLLYVNQASGPELLYADALARSQQERAQWPYSWLHDARGARDMPNAQPYWQVQGQLVPQPASASMPLLDVAMSTSLTEEPALQNLGYTYTARTDAQGRFSLHMPAGDYRMVVYASGGQQAGVLLDRVVHIAVPSGRHTVQLPPMALPLQPTPLWAIGQTDRQATGFALADRPRRYNLPLQVPADWDFEVGKSHDSDWYYAQTQVGTWRILFDDRADGRDRQLTLALAGSSDALRPVYSAPRLVVRMNGVEIGVVTPENDKALYRSANRSGRYSSHALRIPAALLRTGRNTITLQLEGGQVMYDAVLYGTAP
ncbi:polysaccharide lyase family protein [Curvibacter sp. CHRR-16]|uniref:polysaccharide lyase family protein n=1 Tax=Curvibacter sp. CHRR-16 TaxID=2835872 RepID=UPI0020239467|nr:polysaccharide lyase family protein [Curvibacter sp. CHRR-16]